MDAIRLAARSYIQTANVEDLGLFAPKNTDETNSISLHSLWADVSSHRSQDVRGSTLNEDLLVILHVLKHRQKEAPFEEHDKASVQAIYAWLAQISLPSPEFASALNTRYSATEEKDHELSSTLKARQSTFGLAISCIKYLTDILPVFEAEDSVEVLTALLSFISLRDPWTTEASFDDAVAVLQSCMEPEGRSKCWSILEHICESKIRPIFAKTKNPAITATGRKNLHPLPRPRFDDSLFDPESKPWKHRDVYATTVLEWILTQYSTSDINRLENQFHFYIPPILSLIDDESASFKYRGCVLLTKFLTPIRASNSDLLRRTNLSSVFDDALTPLLLSLPSITPEEEALQLLGVAYPALLLTLQTRYHSVVDRDSRKPSSQRTDDKIAYTTRLTALLRDSIISSFHHISSYTPASFSSAENSPSLASFPYPRLSTFLLEQLRIVIQELGIHTTKYLEEIVPVVYGTLTTPFGTACVPLLLAGVAVAQAVVLSAYPRVWRYKGDFLAAVCQCWINVCQDERCANGDEKKKEHLREVMVKLKGTVYLLQLAVQGALAMKVEMDGEESLNAAGVVDEKVVSIEDDFKALVEADGQLKDLFQVEVDGDMDDNYFFE